MSKIIVISKNIRVNRVVAANVVRNFIYGNILALVSLVILSNDDNPTIKSGVVGISLGMLAVFAAHFYADSLSKRLVLQRSLSSKQIGDIIKESSFILVPVIFPEIFLLLTLLHYWDIYMSILLGMISCMLMLLSISIISAKLEKLSIIKSTALIAINLFVGLVVVGFEIVVH